MNTELLALIEGTDKDFDAFTHDTSDGLAKKHWTPLAVVKTAPVYASSVLYGGRTLFP